MTDIAPIATTPWIHPVVTSEPTPVSDRLIRALEAHVAAEAHDIVNCQLLAQHAVDPVVGLLLGMIVEDEQRHHTLLRSMIQRLHEEVEFVASPSALPVPSPVSSGSVTDDPDLTAGIRALIRDEHEAARHVRHLARQDPQLYGGLYPLLLETIARDSEKHAAILRYLLRRTEGSSR